MEQILKLSTISKDKKETLNFDLILINVIYHCNYNLIYLNPKRAVKTIKEP